MNAKMEIRLSHNAAMRIFQKKFPHMVDNWQSILGEPIKPSPDTYDMPEEGKNKFFLMKPSDDTPYSKVLRFSKTHLIIMIVRPRGQYLAHTYFDCLAHFKVPRSPRIDAIFDVSGLEDVYLATFQGLGYGDSVETVEKVLGEPDAKKYFQLGNDFTYFYFEEDREIFFRNATVLKIVAGIHSSLKRKVEGGILYREEEGYVYREHDLF